MATSSGPEPKTSGVFYAAAEALRRERPLRHQRLRAAEQAIREARLVEAGEILSQFLQSHPSDVVAMHLMAETALRTNRREQAEALLERCVSLAPDFAAARYNYANALAQLNKAGAALRQLELLLKHEPRNPLYRNFKASLLSTLGNHAEALSCYAGLAQDFPRSPEILVNYGSALRSVGLTEQCIEAYRKATALVPCGEAYWSLAGLKSYRFSETEIVDMQRQLVRPDLSGEDRMYFHFALGKALGDQAEYAKSFEHYARANALKRMGIDYDPSALTRHVRDCKALFTPGFLKTRAEMGCGANGPIFILGMQRAGSTLVEQILASHSAVEATAELPNISLLAEHIGENIATRSGSTYPNVLAELDRETLRSLGERYLEGTRPQRHLARPFFTDKMPYNFLHVGLIQLILPNAKIVDVRRHPLGCCFSNFAMHFKSGPLFAYRLRELGGAYAKYVELMAHFDSVLPGRIHRVLYEDLIRTPEQEVHRLLEYLGLPFEADCLEFHKHSRAMDSASSEQVRRPIYDDALDQWRHYDPWLGPLKAALGEVLEAYPQVPQFLERQ